MTIHDDRAVPADRPVPANGCDGVPDVFGPTVPGADWLTPSQAGRRLDRTPLRVRQLVDSGRLHAVRTRFGRLIDPASVDALLREREERAAAADGPMGAHE